MDGNIHTIELDSGTIIELEYDFDPGESPNYDVESPTVGPGSEASVEIYKVSVGEHDITEIISEDVRIDWEEQILCSRY